VAARFVQPVGRAPPASSSTLNFSGLGVFRPSGRCRPLHRLTQIAERVSRMNPTMVANVNSYGRQE
jgi:hypothetical protein